MSEERALVLWNFVLYFSACGTCSGIVYIRVISSACETCCGIVEFRVIFLFVWSALWQSSIFCYILCV